MITQSKERRTNRERLLVVSAHLFRTKGYSATSIRDIAKRLRMRNSSLYHYVRSKDELLLEIARQALNDLEVEIKQVLGAGPATAGTLRDLIETHVTRILEEQDKHAAMLTQLNALSPPRRKTIIQLRDRYEDLVLGVLEKAQQAGEIRGDIPAKYLKLALLNLLNWSIFWFRPSGPLRPREIGHILATVFLEGVDGLANKKSRSGQ